MTSSSRIEQAQERVRRSRYAIVAAAGVAFLGLGALVREAHPGRHAAATSSSTSVSLAQAAIPSESSAFSEAATQGFFGNGGSTVSPSQSASPPVVQSSGS